MQHPMNSLDIVLVEPSKAQRRIIHRQFDELGIVGYRSAIDGQTGLAYIEESCPDLVISAMHLPDMTGLDLVRCMRSRETSADTTFMLISTETAFEQLDPVRQAGATAILPKPFNVNHLRAAITTTVDRFQTENLELGELDIENLRVLVVDDSRFARRFIIRTLSGLGIENVTQASDGDAAITLVDAEFFDLVVTDYNMPKVDGMALVDYIRNRSSQRSVPILLVTTEGNEQKLSAIQQAGVSAICDKPFDATLVRDVIEGVFTTV